VAITLVAIISRPQYVDVFGQLNLTDAGDIAGVLQTSGIAYRTTNGGTAIQVRREQADQARITVAQAGLPKSGVFGYENLPSGTWGESEATEQVRLRMVAEGELTRTILSIAGIQDAQVRLGIPEQSPFALPSSQKPTAAVVVKSVRPLDPAQVNGIIQLVSRSIPGLTPDNVTVIDNSGRPLNGAAGGSGTVGEVANQLAVQQAFQGDMEITLRSLLEQVFGAGNVAVRVNSDLSFDKKSSDSVTYTPPGGDGTGLIRTIDELTDSVSGSETAGVPGTDSNLPSYPQGTGAGTTEQDHREKTIKYELNEIKEHIDTAPGEINKLSVAVIVNGDLDSTQTASLTSLVQNSLGLQSGRDTVSVQGLKFSENPAGAPVTLPVATSPVKAAVSQWSWLLGVVAAVVVVALLIVSTRRKSVPVLTGAIEMAASAESSGDGEDDLPETPETQAKKRQRRLEQLAKENPEDFAQLIRTWLNEER
jgi:flagellar M-ring protein FliF